MIFVLSGYHSREPSKYRKLASIIVLVLIQSLIILIKNSAHFNVNLISVMYLFPSSLILFGFIVLHKNINLSRYLSFFKFKRNI